MTRLRELAVGVARRLVRLVLALLAVRLAVGLVGELAAAAVLGPAVVVWGVGRWAALERRLDNRPTPAPASRAVVVAGGGRRVDQGGEHVAFARALVAVSARYLAHCEHQADEDAMVREGWR
jgi:hypothetical protein